MTELLSRIQHVIQSGYLSELFGRMEILSSFWRTIFSLLHVISGFGSPDATQSIITNWPCSTVKSRGSTRNSGGTIKNNNNIYKSAQRNESIYCQIWRNWLNGYQFQIEILRPCDKDESWQDTKHSLVWTMDMSIDARGGDGGGQFTQRHGHEDLEKMSLNMVKARCRPRQLEHGIPSPWHNVMHHEFPRI